jgi:hypothetical protein
MNGSAAAFFRGGITPGGPGGRTVVGSLVDACWALSAASRSVGRESFLRGCDWDMLACVW